MSRIGRKPVILPANVQADITNENVIVVSGPLGSLRQQVDPSITMEKKSLEGSNVIVFSRSNDTKEVKSKHGLYRALIHNMVEGVNKGFEKSLTINGVGYKCSVSGNKLTLNIGFSHPVEIDAPKGIKITCPSITEIKVAGFNKDLVGQVASDIKAIKPVEPYHAYGIRYTDQYVIRKEAKKTIKKK